MVLRQNVFSNCVFLEKDFLNILKDDRAELGPRKATGTFSLSHIPVKEWKEKESGETLDVGTWVCLDILRKKLDIWKKIGSGFFFFLRPGLILKTDFTMRLEKYTDNGR